MIKQKESINKKPALIFLIFAIITLVFLPNRDFYSTLNSFSWGWLDLFLKPVWLGRVVGGSLFILALFILWKNKFYYFLLVTIIVLQVLTFPKIFAMHRWLSSDFQALIKPIKTLAIEQQIENFYITEDYLDKDLLGNLYFAKYLLLFYDDQFEPIQVIKMSELEGLKSNFAYLDTPQGIKEFKNTFTTQLPVTKKLMIGIKEDQT